jgi:uncharacterized protein (TIGR02145 family)
LYQWEEAMQYETSEGSQGICPTGWHMPSYTEFQILGDSVNNNGNALKAIGQGTGEGAGTNTSGFSALLAGYRHYDAFYHYGFFRSLGHEADFWSSSGNNGFDAAIMALSGNSDGIYLSPINYVEGFSVRCIKD